MSLTNVEKYQGVGEAMNKAATLRERADLCPHYENAARMAYIEILGLGQRAGYSRLLGFENEIWRAAEESGIFSEGEIERIVNDASRAALSLFYRKCSPKAKEAKEIFRILSPTAIGSIVPMGEMWGHYIPEGVNNYSCGSRLDTNIGIAGELMAFAPSLGSDFVFYLNQGKERQPEEAPQRYHIDFFSPSRVYKYLKSSDFEGIAKDKLPALTYDNITKEGFLQLMTNFLCSDKRDSEQVDLAGILYAYPIPAIKDYIAHNTEEHRKQGEQDGFVFAKAGEVPVFPDGSVAYYSNKSICTFKTWRHPNPEIQAEREELYEKAIARRNFCISVAEAVLDEVESL